VPTATPRFLIAIILSLTTPGRADFLADVRPVLKARCFSCHGALKAEAGLRLDSVSAMQQGGESGPLLADHAELLLSRITSTNESERMPPEGAPLSSAQIDSFRAWIAAGSPAPVPDDPEPDPRSHWAFQVPRPTQPPDALPPGSDRGIDRFLAAHHAARGLEPQSPASPDLWLRRVTFDLTGLPPSQEQLSAFLSDHSPDARSRTVDQLLGSPHFGERWARHFMDLWRYADWWGLDQQLRYSQKHIWHWRDWIVESLNSDRGLNRMIMEMLAADELAPDDQSSLRATGFLCRPYYLFNRTTWLDEVVEHTSRAFLGLTMQCVKCHDHKYDPLSHTDYYRFRAIFEPYHVRVDAWPGETDFEKNGLPRAFDLHTDRPTYLHRRGDEKQADTSKPLAPGIPALFGDIPITPVPLPPAASHPGTLAHFVASQQQAAAAEIASLVAAGNQPERHAAASLRPDLIHAIHQADSARASRHAEAPALAARAATMEAVWKVATAAAHAAESARAAATAPADKKEELTRKADAATTALAKACEAAMQPGERYTPLTGSLKALEGPDDSFDRNPHSYPATSTGRRLALARWITGPTNPLTPRVLVNHVWLRLTGHSFVPDPSDFGLRCPPPPLQNLLDHLATEFSSHQWQLKPLIRSVVLSRAYQSASSPANRPREQLSDPENSFLWRMNPRRLESQAVRDGILSLAGILDPAMGGPPIPVPAGETSRRRALYLQQHGELEDRFLGAFDNASVFECYRRRESVTPQQALALTNSRIAREAARSMADRFAALPDPAFITTTFTAVLGRAPSPAETDACQRGLASFQQQDAPQARAHLVLALFSHNDFVTLR
jgi:hypothetical protein